jgi:hypothetical protein
MPDTQHPSESVEWVRRTHGTTTRVDLTRLTSGHVMCAICFGYTLPADLEPSSDGAQWDVCRSCAEEEKAHGATF